jgi:hypothetical protein
VGIDLGVVNVATSWFPASLAPQLHPASRLNDHLEAHTSIDLVGVLRCEEEKANVADLWVIDGASHDELPKALSASATLDEHIAEPSECGPVGDPSRKRHLLMAGAEATERYRPRDRLLHNILRSSWGPVALLAQPPMDRLHVEQVGFIGDVVAILSLPVHRATLRPQSTELASGVACPSMTIGT